MKNLFLQNATSSTTSNNQAKPPVNSDETNRPVNPTTVKSSDVSTKDENYHMIPIDRKEQNRPETEPVSNKDNNDEQQSKIKKGNNSQETSAEEIKHEQPSVKRTTSNEEYVLDICLKKIFFISIIEKYYLVGRISIIEILM